MFRSFRFLAVQVFFKVPTVPQLSQRNRETEVCTDSPPQKYEGVNTSDEKVRNVLFVSFVASYLVAETLGGVLSCIMNIFAWEHPEARREGVGNG